MIKKIKNLDNKTEWIIISLIVGLIYIIEGIIFLILELSEVLSRGIIIGILFIIISGILFISSFIISRQDKRDYDERLIKIRYKANTHGFFALLIVQINLCLIDMALPDAGDIPIYVFLLAGVISFNIVSGISKHIQKKLS